MDGNAFLIRNLAYPLMQTFKGNRVLNKRSFLISSSRMNPEALRALQWEKLRILLRTCNEGVHAYRHRWSDEEIQADPLRCLRETNPLSKAEFRGNAPAFLRDGVDPARLIANRTGGSTGEPLKFYLDRETVEWYEAARWRGLHWWAIHPWSRSVMVWGSPIELSQAKRLSYVAKERFLKNRIMIPAYNLQKAEIEHYRRLLERFRPDYVYGYASALGALSGMIKDAGRRLTHRPKAVVFTAEGLAADDQTAVAEVFQCPVVGEYGARDAGILAFQCPRGGLHVTAENAVLELIDPVSGRPASSGAVAVTDLNNLTQPRLRYLLGDWATWGDDCSCGMNLPVLAGVEGREDAILVAENGSLVHGHVVAHIARNIEGIHQIQLLQKSREEIRIFVVTSSSSLSEGISTELIGKLRQWLGSLEFRIEFLDQIQPAASGKVRYAIREFPLQQ